MPPATEPVEPVDELELVRVRGTAAWSERVDSVPLELEAAGSALVVSVLGDMTGVSTFIGWSGSTRSMTERGLGLGFAGGSGPDLVTHRGLSFAGTGGSGTNSRTALAIHRGSGLGRTSGLDTGSVLSCTGDLCADLAIHRD